MTMERWISVQERQGNDAAAKMGRTLLDLYGDVDPEEAQSTSLLDSVVETYQNQPHTPELITQTHQAIWQLRGELVGATYEVSPYPYTQEEITELEASGQRIGYLPPELATQEKRHILGEIAPEMQSHNVKEGNSVTNDENHSGWFDYEVAIDAPYLDTKEKKLEGAVKKDGRRLLTLNEYIVAGLDNKLFTGKYLDEDRTRVRLASRYDGRMIHAYFSSGGHLRVYSDLYADFHYSSLGGRSSGVKKA